jgi:hypothetical protein
VWEAVFHWLGRRISTYFLSFGNLFKSKKGGRINHLIWLATYWNNWKHRNNVILFNGITPNASTLLEDIKIFSWLWFSGRHARNSSIPFSNWCNNPLSFIFNS